MVKDLIELFSYSKEKSNLSQKWVFFSYFLWFLLFILWIVILFLWINKYNIVLSWDNLVYLTWWLFVIWLFLIIFPMYFWVREQEINKEINLEIKQKEETVLKNQEEKLMELLSKNDNKKTMTEMKELYKAEYGSTIDNAVFYGLKIENKPENSLIRRKQGLLPLISYERWWNIKLTNEWKEYLWIK